MPIPKWIELQKNKSLSGDSGTETYSIKRTDQILELVLKVRAKNGATRNSPDAAAIPTIESSITNIEIKSGSASFKSYTGEVCRKIAAYRNGRLPQTLYTQEAGGTWAGNEDPSLGWQEYTFPINFNLPQDPYGNKTGVMLPAPLYDSLDLVLDYNFTISATAGYVTGGSNHLFDLYALVLPKEDRAAMVNKRILVETKKQDYTSVASGDQPFDLTLDSSRFLRQLMVTAYENGVGEGVDITDLKYKVDGDTYWAGKWGDLQALNAQDSHLNYKFPAYLNAATTTDELWTRIPAARPIITPITSPTTAPFSAALSSGDKVTVTTDAQADNNILDVYSDVLPAAVVIDLDRDGSLMNMQYAGVKDMDLILTNGGAGAAVQIIEQHIAKPWGYSGD
ncbi:MAG TPA: hypothetical protein VN368_01000 [Candidatus Methylomirabilis sp.]|nr:hypothetical protein [Candidatus Methylomirabilis sp.]